MSFLSVFFRFLLLFIIIGVGGFFGARELLLYTASQQVANDARELTRQSVWKELVSRCEAQIVTEAPFNGFQLRFTSPTAYNLEASCTSALPAVWKSKKLAYGVKKTTGSAGFYFDFESKLLSGEVTLELWGQKRVVYGDSEGTGQSWGSTELRASRPASVCVAHGGQCCDAQQQIGEGDALVDGVTDCSGQCFASCLQRPVLLSFQTDPFTENETREVNLPGTSGLVLFSYVFDDSDAPIKKVTIDFGDGTKEEKTTRNAQVTKTYECAQVPCRYTVTIVAEDTRGIDSSLTRLSQLVVVVGAPVPEDTYGTQ